MCRSKVEGGQRCFGHAVRRFQIALDKYEVALVDTSGRAEERQASAAERLLHRATELASTTDGLEMVQELAVRAREESRVRVNSPAVLTMAGLLDRAVEAGPVLRERNARVLAEYRWRQQYEGKARAWVRGNLSRLRGAHAAAGAAASAAFGSAAIAVAHQSPEWAITTVGMAATAVSAASVMRYDAEGATREALRRAGNEDVRAQHEAFMAAAREGWNWRP